jgi:stage II sporulation protein D
MFNFRNIYIISFVVLFLWGCSSTERFTRKEEFSKSTEKNFIRLLIDGKSNELEFAVESPVYLLGNEKKVALINPGNKVKIVSNGNETRCQIRDKIFEAEYFNLVPQNNSFTYRGKEYKGNIKVTSSGDSIRLINSIGLEEYLKGVIPKEMPLGKGEEYYEALKAFAICARTYAIMKMTKNQSTFDKFDVYTDVRDQVYGGAAVENPLSNRAVDETKNMIIAYNGLPAIVFYHSTCGGYTEDVSNVFSSEGINYLSGVEDGNPPFCSSSRSFEWEEIYSKDNFINKLLENGVISNNLYTIQDITVQSRFPSGRVNELRIIVRDDNEEEKTINLVGNNIRSIIRTADNKSILKSNWFDVSFDQSENIIIKGKGYGHGVGLCQWGALFQSTQGTTYKEILSHYFPGTTISSYND